jgi:nucleotide-binding universal stress UspA family protein
MSVFLVATDGSVGGTSAVREAAKLAAGQDAELVVLTVTPRDLAPRTETDEIREFARTEHLSSELEARSLIAEDILAEAKAIVGERGGLKATYTSRAGDPAKEILACARQRAASMIILGSRGYGALGAFLYGSVSRKVADLAPCTVTIVPPTR